MPEPGAVVNPRPKSLRQIAFDIPSLNDETNYKSLDKEIKNGNILYAYNGEGPNIDGKLVRIKHKYDENDLPELPNEGYVDGMLVSEETGKFYYFFAGLVGNEDDDKNGEDYKNFLKSGKLKSYTQLREGQKVLFEPIPAGICEVELYDSEFEDINNLTAQSPVDSHKMLYRKKGATIFVKFVRLIKIIDENEAQTAS